MAELDELTDLQLDVMQVLWERVEATATEVRGALAERGLVPRRRPAEKEKGGLAHTTVTTLLARLERKGLVAHRAEGRQFVYHALVSESEVCRAVVESVLRRFFHGDRAALIRYLEAGISP